jgi:hypothetical protein
VIKIKLSGWVISNVYKCNKNMQTITNINNDKCQQQTSIITNIDKIITNIGKIITNIDKIITNIGIDKMRKIQPNFYSKLQPIPMIANFFPNFILTTIFV